MHLKKGTELEFVAHRLNDIVFFCENTKPVDGASWEDYAQSCFRLIANSAREAQSALNLVKP
jgi:hypothetical protein